MTYITSKFEKMTPDMQEELMSECCPSDYGLVDAPECTYFCQGIPCEDCWKRALDRDRDSEKKKEENMKVEVMRKVEVEIEEFWVLRGIHINMSDKKEVVAEQVMITEPTKEDIATFLVDNVPRGVDFCSVEHNYRFKD